MKEKFKRCLIVTLSFCLLFSCISINAQPTYAATSVQSVYINPLKKAVPGGSYQLSYTVTPSTASYTTKSWSVDSSCGTISGSGLLKVGSSTKAGSYKVTLVITDSTTQKDYTSSLYITVSSSDTTTTTQKATTTKKSTTTTKKATTTTKKATTTTKKSETTTKAQETTTKAKESTTVAETTTKVETTTAVTQQEENGDELNISLGGISTKIDNDCLVVTMTQVADASGYILYIATEDGEYQILYSGGSNIYTAHMLDLSKTLRFKYYIYKYNDDGNIVMSGESQEAWYYPV